MDLWPYVNGKALYQKIRLGELEMSEMLDMFHFFYEEDSIPKWEQEGKAKSKLREFLYRDFYGREYPYKYYDEDEPYDPTGPYSPPEKGETKPYVPPTDPKELQGIVGSPLK